MWFSTRNTSANNNAVSAAMALNEWVFVAGVCSSAGLKNTVYINAVSEGETDYDTIEYSSGSPVNRAMISDMPYNDEATTFRGRLLRGVINDIRIFNKALSETEISAIFNATKGFYGIT